ncbi:MAG: putative cupin superfamily protein [Parasphingorhabdus sp.]|jgi:uncharacterized cupin superfamily protein
MNKNIITKEQINSAQGLEKTHFLNANARRTNKSLGDMVGLSGFGFHIIEIQSGNDSTEFHKHYFEDECVYILDGSADAFIGDEVCQVKAGDFLGYPAGGLAHSLTNSGDSVLRCIVVGERLNHDVADYPKLNKRIFRNRGLSWNLVDLDKIVQPDAGRKI